MTDFNRYLANESFPEGTVFANLDLIHAEVSGGGYVVQTKRGVLEGDECKRIFTTVADWLKSIPIYSPEDAYRINIVTPKTENKKIIPPYFPIYMPTSATPFEIVKTINEKFNIEFNIKRCKSLNMIYNSAKIRCLELESKESWQTIKICDPSTWQNLYDKKASDALNAYLNVQNSLNPNIMPYQVHTSKYPRVFVKCDDTMEPIYHITDGTEYVYKDGKVGNTWESIGLNSYPEFWISWEGKMVRQRIQSYIPYNTNAVLNQENFTQLSLSLMYEGEPDDEGCLPSGRQVINLKTNKYIQPWQIV